MKVALANDNLNLEDIEEFVDALPVRGRTSVLKLLEASGCGVEERTLIECVRDLRNGFAHDIKQMDSSLIDVIKKRKDKTRLLKGLCWVEQYEEDKLIQMYEKDGGALRFGIVTGALVFMIAAYYSVIEPPISEAPPTT